MNKYNDILNYNYVMKHERMSKDKRASQFAPFSALVGFTDLIKERERDTTRKIEITDDIKEELDYKLKIINSKLDDHPKVTITYFIKDQTKSGGKYETITNYIKRIDFYHKIIILENQIKIKIDNIINIDSLDIDFRDFLS